MFLQPNSTLPYFRKETIELEQEGEREAEVQQRHWTTGEVRSL